MLEKKFLVSVFEGIATELDRYVDGGWTYDMARAGKSNRKSNVKSGEEETITVKRFTDNSEKPQDKTREERQAECLRLVFVSKINRNE